MPTMYYIYDIVSEKCYDVDQTTELPCESNTPVKFYWDEGGANMALLTLQNTHTNRKLVIKRL